MTIFNISQPNRNPSKAVVPLRVLLAVGTLFSTAILTHATDTDSRIETAAKSSYVFKTYLKDDSIQTKSKNGMVVLTGSVTEASHKALAENAVENLPGVVSVKNQLRVKGQSSTMHSDLELAAKVKTALRFHRHVSADKTEVAVKDSVVTLTGEADSVAQKDLTSEYAKDIDGVKSVKNDMTIAKSEAAAPTMGEKIDDASTTAQVKFSLLSHRSTSALKTSVKTTDGVVTISGIAKNDTEKALVAKLVSDINGVVSVVNNMTIAAPVAAR